MQNYFLKDLRTPHFKMQSFRERTPQSLWENMGLTLMDIFLHPGLLPLVIKIEVFFSDRHQLTNQMAYSCESATHSLSTLQPLKVSCLLFQGGFYPHSSYY